MAATTMNYSDSRPHIGAAAALAAAERRRALLTDAKEAWLTEFEEFKRSEARAAADRGLAPGAAPKRAAGR
jgi:hypothetical protein